MVMVNHVHWKQAMRSRMLTLRPRVMPLALLIMPVRLEGLSKARAADSGSVSESWRRKGGSGGDESSSGDS